MKRQMLYKTFKRKHEDAYLSIYILHKDIYAAWMINGNRHSITLVSGFKTTERYIQALINNQWTETTQKWVDPSGAIRSPPIMY
jgi:hypothetical protein